ncbi:MAG TPA: carboxypeptidase regulatory-like domain-containing protein [bacterium]|nr:carboxypeptidase regulatory-like domain-containing protein [bacterium]HPQ66326.1 carboxypeptidase regulatory-like domain-containing protein [bacterium]
MKKSFLYALIWMLAGAAVAVGADPEPGVDPASPPAEAPVPGVLRVKVLSDLGKPVANARATVYATRDARGEQLSPCGGGFEAIELEPVSGTEFEKALAPNVYRVEVSAPGRVGRVEKEVELKPGETRELEVELEPGDRIPGRVEVEAGVPLEGARVSYSATGMDSAPYLYSVERAAVTDADGRFELSGMPAGVYLVSASADGYIKNSRLETPTGTDNLRIVLRQGSVIKGRLAGDLEGLPLAVSLSFKNGRSSTSRDVVLGPESTFTVSDLEKGNYNVRVKEKEYVSDWAVDVPAVAPEEARPIVLTVRRGASVSGRVLDAVTKIPLSGTMVYLSPVSGAGEEIDMTGEGGEYEFQGVAAGDYRLKVRSWYDSFGAEREQEGKEIGLASGEELDGVTLEVASGRWATLKGLTVDEAGRPVAGAEIDVYCRPAGQKGFHSNFRYDPVSDETGAFAVEIFVPAEAEIKLIAEKDGYADSPEEPVALGADRTVAEGIVLQLNSGKDLTVEVEDEEGRALVGAVVTLEPDWSSRSGRIFRYSSQKKLSDSRGRCFFRHLAPGEFVVRAAKDGYGPAAEEFTIPAGGEAERATVVLAPGRDLRVTVKNTRGKAVEGAKIYFQDTTPGSPRASFPSRGEGRTDSRGVVVLSDLPARSGRLMVEAEGYTRPRGQAVADDQVEVEVVLNDAGSLSGRFLSAAGQPMSDVRIRTRKRKKGPFDFETNIGLGMHKFELGDGTFRFTGIAPGEYDVTVISPGMAVATISGVTVAPGRETDLGEIELRPEGTIAGSVADRSTGDPLEKFSVQVKGWRIADSFSQLDRAAGGVYTVKGLDAGDYTLIVSASEYRRKEITGIMLSAGEHKELPRVELEPLTPEEQAERDRQRHVLPSLGVRIGETGVEDRPGLMPIAEVLPGSTAEAGGLRAGDAIKKVNGKSLEDDLGGFLTGLMSPPGTRLKLTVVRAGTGEEEEIEVELGEWDLEEYIRKMTE